MVFENLKEGTYHRALGIPADKKIPISISKAIVRTKLPKKGAKTKSGRPAKQTKRIDNPTKRGKRKIIVTRALKKKANFDVNRRKFKHGKRKG